MEGEDKDDMLSKIILLPELKTTESILFALFLCTVFGGILSYPFIATLELGRDAFFVLVGLWIILSSSFLVSSFITSVKKTYHQKRNSKTGKGTIQKEIKTNKKYLSFSPLGALLLQVTVILGTFTMLILRVANTDSEVFWGFLCLLLISMPYFYDVYSRTIQNQNITKKSIRVKENIESTKSHSKGILYVRAKNKLIAERERLETLLKQDINTLGSTSSSNYEIYHMIELFSKNIIDTTDSLISALPEDTSIMSEFDDREEFYRYLDYLLYEMSWIKEISATMQKEIQTWMVYHHIEVQQEKAKMEQILREENTKLADSMSTLLATSSALRERSDDTQIEDILVRQRI